MDQATILRPRPLRGSPSPWIPSRPGRQPASRLERRRQAPAPPAAAARGARLCCAAAPAPAAAGAAAGGLDIGVDVASLAQRDLRGTVAVVGAGPAGLAAAAALHQAGLPVVVLERGPSLSPGGSALGLWTNAWRALDALGAGDALRRQHPQVHDIELVRHSGRRLRRFGLGECDGGPHEFRGVRRASLLAALASRLPPASLAFGARVAAVEPGPCGAAVLLESGQRLACLAVVGADGARSAVAAAAGRPPPNYCGQSAVRGVACFPGGLRPELAADCIRQVWGPAARAGTYPVSDTELYWFVCFNADADAATPAAPEAWRQEAAAAVRGWAWGLPDIVAATPAESLSRSRLVDRWDLPPLGGGGGGCLTLAGDALHPMTPNLGQGGCTALEDAVVLARCLQQQRLPHLAAGVTTSGGGQAAEAAAAEAVRSALREYERQRAARCLPLTVRSHVMGALLQAPLPPVALARDVYVQHAFSPAHFLDHAAFDCGRLEHAPQE